METMHGRPTLRMECTLKLALKSIYDMLKFDLLHTMLQWWIWGMSPWSKGSPPNTENCNKKQIKIFLK